jgi:hypothetical protein
MSQIGIYDERFLPALLGVINHDGMLPDGAIIRTENALIWTEGSGVGDEPRTIIINTMACRYTYTVPKLMVIRGRYTLYSALSDIEPSGQVRNIRKYYILVRH